MTNGISRVRMAFLVLLMLSFLLLGMKEVDVIPSPQKRNLAFTFGIYQRGPEGKQGERVGTAYYKFTYLTQGSKDLLEIRYTGKGKELSESSISYLDAQTLLPISCSQKRILNGTPYFVDIVYGSQETVIKRKKGSELPKEERLNVAGKVYDFEGLLYVVTKMKFRDRDDQAYVSVYSAPQKTAMIFVIEKGVKETIQIGRSRLEAIPYSLSSTTLKTTIWIADIEGEKVPVKYDTGKYIFLTLSGESKHQPVRRLRRRHR